MHYDTTRFVSTLHDVVITLAQALFSSSLPSSSSSRVGAPRSFYHRDPVSLIATLIVMKMLGFSLNMLSLLGMVLAIGFVTMHRGGGKRRTALEAALPLAATRAAMKEVTGPITATPRC
jgi:HAE1 family hydrophobic/amphiphilic exporter-1